MSNILENIMCGNNNVITDTRSLESYCFKFENKYDLNDYSMRLNEAVHGFLIVHVMPRGKGKVLEWLDKYHDLFIDFFDVRLFKVEVESVIYEGKSVDYFELVYTYRSNPRIGELSVDSLRDTLNRY